MPKIQKIMPCLWFDTEAEEAANFYISVFKKNSKILNITHYPNVGHEVHGQSAGSVLTVRFIIDGNEFLALNGGPQFKFTEAISLCVDCKNQEEIDYYWEKLSEGGEKGPCGWLKDKYGLWWQTTSTLMTEKMLDNSDPARADKVFEAIMKMTKIDIKKLENAYNGK